MNEEWREKFTAEHGGVADAHVDEVGNIGFGSKAHAGEMSIGPALDYSAPVLVELSRLAVIDVDGEDAAEFLQAQVCNDLKAISSDQLQINGYCSPKGRLMAVFTVFAHNNGYRLVLPADIAPAFTKRLQMFVMRAKVTITPRTDLICSGLVLDAKAQTEAASDAPKAATVAVDQALSTVLAALPSLPESVLGLTSNDAAQVLRWHDDTGNAPSGDVAKVQARYLCIGSVDTLFPLWQSDQFSHAAWSYWRWGDINAGMPNVFAASTDQFIPQMLNMQLINALSFKKGCYPGQEIVARMQYLGKLKKHMKHLYQPGGTVAPEPGTTLTTEANNNAGQVVDAVVDEHGVNLLAVVNIQTPVSDLRLAEQGLQEAVVPYSLAPKVDSGNSADAETAETS